jgi:plasmid maintenance system antidote protein VapI
MPRMLSTEIRRENARWLATQCGGSARFSEAIGASESRVSQLIGKAPSKNIGSATARKIEAAFGKTEGWLDQPNAWAAEENQPATEAAVLAGDVARLVLLFGQCSDAGRKQILRMAENAEKLL